MKLSVTIITYNEEKNIKQCLDHACQYADEVIVVDSYGQDRTKEICLSFKEKVKFFERKFTNYGDQKNYAATKANYDWILNIDADEMISKDLGREVINLLKVSHNIPSPIYQIPRLNYFFGKPMYHGGLFPDYKNRLYNQKFAHWSTPHVHEDVILLEKKSHNGQAIRKLNGLLHHYTFPKVDDQIKANIKYAHLGALALKAKKEQQGKKLSFLEVIFRPFFKFLECYVLKLGLLDGRYGLIVAINASYSMFMKYSKAYIDLGSQPLKIKRADSDNET